MWTAYRFQSRAAILGRAGIPVDQWYTDVMSFQSRAAILGRAGSQTPMHPVSETQVSIAGGDSGAGWRHGRSHTQHCGEVSIAGGDSGAGWLLLLIVPWVVYAKFQSRAAILGRAGQYLVGCILPM